jgi:hypothetical protein
MSSPAERVERYWSLTPGDELRLPRSTEYIDAYASVLETVVRDRLRDAPVGILLSGGLDSSSVAAALWVLSGTMLPIGFVRTPSSTTPWLRTRNGSTRASWLATSESRSSITRSTATDGSIVGTPDLLPPEPSTEPMTAMMADLLERVARHSAVALTGDGGDPALLPSPLIRLLRHRAPHLVVSEFARSLWQTRSLPPIGLRAMVRQWLAPRAGRPRSLHGSPGIRSAM